MLASPPLDGRSEYSASSHVSMQGTATCGCAGMSDPQREPGVAPSVQRRWDGSVCSKKKGPIPARIRGFVILILALSTARFNSPDNVQKAALRRRPIDRSTGMPPQSLYFKGFARFARRMFGNLELLGCSPRPSTGLSVIVHHCAYRSMAMSRVGRGCMGHSRYEGPAVVVI